MFAASYWAVPTLLSYLPGDVERHPDPPPHDDELVTAMLTDESEVVEFQWLAAVARPDLVPRRDTVTWEGTDRALVGLAELPLDTGNDHDVNEVNLEVPGRGYGGVDPTSAEMTFWLPGSDAWFSGDFATLGGRVRPVRAEWHTD